MNMNTLYAALQFNIIAAVHLSESLNVHSWRNRGVALLIVTFIYTFTTECAVKRKNNIIYLL